jgi:hypothetical protein
LRAKEHIRIEMHKRRKNEWSSYFVAVGPYIFGVDAIHRLVLGLRVGSFLTGRLPGGGAPCIPIVKMLLPLLPVVGVCGVDAPNVPVGV